MPASEDAVHIKYFIDVKLCAIILDCSGVTYVPKGQEFFPLKTLGAYTCVATRRIAKDSRSVFSTSRHQE